MSHPSTNANLADTSMLQGSVNKTLLLMSAPISLGMLSTFLFQVVDTFFVGKLGPAPLAALGFASSAYFFSVAVFMGLSVGISALVGSALGSGDRDLAKRHTTLAIVSSVFAAALLSALGILGNDFLFSLLGASADLLPLLDAYMGTLYFGLPALVFGLIASAALRASGNIRAPEIVMGLAGLINLGMDYLLIFGVGLFPELGLEGAALATVFSWIFVLFCSAFLLVRRKLLTFKIGNPTPLLHSFLRLSAPAVATQVLLPLTAMFITFLAAKSGSDVVAAIGVASRIEMLVLVGISSVSVAIVPFLAQNFGAERSDRVDEAIAFAGKASFYWGFAALLVLVVFAQTIAEVFSSDPEIIQYTELYFYIVAFSYGPAGIVMVTSSIFNGVMIPQRSLRILLVKTFALTIPLAVLGSLFGAVGIFVAISASNVLAFFYAGRLMKQSLRESGSSLAEVKIFQSYINDWQSIKSRVFK